MLRSHNSLRKANIEIVQGGAKGADMYARRFARKYEFDSTQFDADWDTYGKRAGYIRNVEMAKYAKQADITMLIAFPTRDVECRGTENMIEIARECNFDYIIQCFVDVLVPFR